ncbi:MAG: hypothetical protein PUC11_00605 [Elusimicrobia bacterium]|nr:hypothetical protein [Elusimicrobiota bacterium]
MPNLFSVISRRVLFPLTVFGLAGGVYAESFPLCMYGVDNPADVKTVKRAGFNCIQTYKRDFQTLSSLAQAAQKEGVELVVYPTKLTEENLAAAREWPILAWYLVDEPDVARISYRDVQKLNQAVKASFPNHQTALVVGQGSHAKNYHKSADVLMVDWYPVYHLPLTSFGEQIRTAKQIMADGGQPEKPLWGVVQAFDWREFKQYRPDTDRIGRFPTVQEMRFMAYDGVLEGMNGIFFFIFTSNGVPLPQAKPEHWSRVVRVAKEISRIRPVFEKGAKLPSPVTGNANVKAGRWLYKGYYYDVIVNRSSSEERLPSEFTLRSYKALFGVKNKTLAPLSVLVLKSKNK